MTSDGDLERCAQNGAMYSRSPMSIFQSVSMIDVLEQDPRPAFVLDLHEYANPAVEACLKPIFCNAAFRDQAGLLEIVRGQLLPAEYGQPSASTYAAFTKWVVQRDGPDVPRGYNYDGMSWTSATINGRWKMVNAIREQHKARSTGAFRKASWGPNTKSSPFPSKEPRSGSQASSSAADGRSSAATFLQETPDSGKSRSSFDWTAASVPPDVSSHIMLARSIDWMQTSLGPMKLWSPCLRNTLNLLMVTPSPALVLWGDDHVVLYNEAYVPIAGAKHPAAFGAAAMHGFSEAWDQFEPFVTKCKHTGHGATFEDMQFFLDRGFCDQEETYFNLTITPVSETSFEVSGFYEQIVETTSRKIAERRMSTILELGERTSKARDLTSFWASVASALQTNTFDISFAAIYSVCEDMKQDDSQRSPSSKSFHLQERVGIPSGHASTPEVAGRNSMKGFTAYFADTLDSGDMLYCSVDEHTLDPSLLVGLFSQGFLDPCKSAVILPITPTTGHENRDTALGFIILGLNTRRPFDSDYQQFIRVLRRQLTTSMASVLLLEQEIKRGRTIAEQAALDQKLLEEKLQERTREVEARRLELKHFADVAGVGLSVITFAAEFPNGQYTYRNDKWWELTSGDKAKEENIPVEQLPVWHRIHKEDLIATREHWQGLLSDQVNRTIVLRLAKAESPDPDNEADWRWLLAYSLSVLDHDGEMVSVITSLTDITAQKQAESAQKRLASEAIEAKLQQENFIDVTSHEMRNPLSAIMISADDIINSLKPLETYSELQEAIRSAVDAAQVIADCAQHQRRIVDDILTISKLDSGLFSFTPVACSIEVYLSCPGHRFGVINLSQTVVNNLLKMIEPELVAGGISKHLEIDPSFQILGISQVLLDPSRLLQILINLLTNAVKFTKYANDRNITLYLRASLEQPSRTMHGHDYLPQREQRGQSSLSKDTNNDSKVFLEFCIEDSGKGLSMSEKELLFQRFSQAPKTHVHYGGSGLGLFISRELVELQGGQIGVASEGKDQGCKFSFYVAARRIMPSEEAEVQVDCNTASLSHSHSNFAIRSALEYDCMDVDLPTPALESRSRAPSLAAPGTMWIKHALIVEDNLVNQRVLRKQLERLDYKVSIANHGQEALDFLLNTTFAKDHAPNAPEVSIVLLDSEMPVLDGLSAVRQIRKMQTQGIFQRHIPVIAITANVRMEQVNEALEAGMDDVVAKPFRVPELVKQIEKLRASSEARVRDNG